MIETKIGKIKDPVARFFAYLQEREAIRIRRQILGRSWTEDPILQRYRFCNVYREDDRTTRWFAKYVREPLRNKPEVMLATVIFRAFNLIRTGEAIFLQTDIVEGQRTAFETFLLRGNVDALEIAVNMYCGRGPYTTGSYMISSPHGMNKVKGICRVLHRFNTDKHSFTFQGDWGIGWGMVASTMLEPPQPYNHLEDVWAWLRKFYYLGDFNSYEIVTDLRHTDLLNKATDIMTWANAGPGAKRGLNLIHGRSMKGSAPRLQYLAEMQGLLAESSKYWPNEILGAKTVPFEMRDIEHGLCEFFKYEKTRMEQGRPRGVFKQ